MSGHFACRSWVEPILSGEKCLAQGTQRRASGEYQTRDTNTLPMSLKVGANIETWPEVKIKKNFHMFNLAEHEFPLLIEISC